MLWANSAEQYVENLKEVITKDVKASNAPLVLWCYFSELCSKIINATDRDNYHLNGQTKHTLSIFQPTDI